MEKEHPQCKLILSSTWQNEATTVAHISDKVHVCVLRVCQTHSCGQNRFRQTDRRPAVRVAHRSLLLYLCKYIQVWLSCLDHERPITRSHLSESVGYGRCGPGPLGSQENIPLRGRLLSVTSRAELFKSPSGPQQTLTLHLPQILLEQTLQQQRLYLTLVIVVSLSVSFWNIL